MNDRQVTTQPEPKSAQPALADATPALLIKDLNKTYNTGLEALKGISLKVEEGDFFALLGPNGAGKSTTIGIICTLILKSSGQVQVFGKDIEQEANAIKKMIGVVPQEFNFSVFEKVGDIVTTQGGYFGLPLSRAKAVAEKYLRMLGLWEMRDMQGRHLSGGMKRRLMVARAMVHEPKLLILDEPTAGVDIEMRRSLWDFMAKINSRGTTIILTTHYLEEAESLCRNIAIIDQGLIVQDSSMNDLLRLLDVETFVLDLDSEFKADVELPGFTFRQVDTLHLEVEVRDSQDISEVFQMLHDQGVKVGSLRNKYNRLEQLFLRFTGNAPEGLI